MFSYHGALHIASQIKGFRDLEDEGVQQSQGPGRGGFLWLCLRGCVGTLCCGWSRCWSTLWHRITQDDSQSSIRNVHPNRRLCWLPFDNLWQFSLHPFFIFFLFFGRTGKIGSFHSQVMLEHNILIEAWISRDRANEAEISWSAWRCEEVLWLANDSSIVRVLPPDIDASWFVMMWELCLCQVKYI